MKPFRQGIEAFRNGSWFKTGNPFNEGTSRHKDWELGFNTAYFENLEKVKERERKRKKRIG